MDSKVDGNATPVETRPQEAAVVADEEGLDVFGKGTSCGAFVSSTRSRGDSEEKGEESGLLTRGLAVALLGHWRAAETQFVDTARRVRSCSGGIVSQG